MSSSRYLFIFSHNEVGVASGAPSFPLLVCWPVHPKERNVTQVTQHRSRVTEQVLCWRCGHIGGVLRFGVMVRLLASFSGSVRHCFGISQDSFSRDWIS